MAAQVMQAQKKDDPLTGMVASMGAEYLKSKIGGGAGKAAEAAKGSGEGQGTGINEMMDAFGAGGGAKNSTASNPRDRRMSKGY